jgi:hypothetical protein
MKGPQLFQLSGTHVRISVLKRNMAATHAVFHRLANLNIIININNYKKAHESSLVSPVNYIRPHARSPALSEN